MAATLELFLQGGLGNQLIQHAYAVSLMRRTDARLRLNPLLLSPGWALFHRATIRPRTPWLAGYCPETRLWPRQCLQWMRFRSAYKRGLALHDGMGDEQIVALLRADNCPSWLPLLGYFQRAQALGSEADEFWCVAAERLREQHLLRSYPAGQVAVHIRLGDYLLPQNQLIYASQAIDQQLSAALSWRERLGGTQSLQVITDDPLTFRRLCPDAYRQEVNLVASSDTQTDFLTLACHRHIVTSNSTFSLCASKLASMLWGQTRTALVARYWFVDCSLDSLQQQEWMQLQFVVDFWPC